MHRNVFLSTTSTRSYYQLKLKMHHFKFKSAFVKCRFHKSVYRDGPASKVFTIFLILLNINVTTSLISFYSAHRMISSTLPPVASRLTPSRQTARLPFSFLQSFLNKLDVVTNAPLRHVQLREAGACCSPTALQRQVCRQEQPAGAEPAARTVLFLSCNQRDIFAFCISFRLDIPLIYY